MPFYWLHGFHLSNWIAKRKSLLAISCPQRGTWIRADTYKSGAGRYGCRGRREVPDKSLIQAVVKGNIVQQRADTVRVERLHGEPRADHRGRVQVQVHVSPEGREAVVQGVREGPPAAMMMALSGHIVGQVLSIRVNLHWCYKHVVWRKRKKRKRAVTLRSWAWVETEVFPFSHVIIDLMTLANTVSNLHALIPQLIFDPLPNSIGHWPQRYASISCFYMSIWRLTAARDKKRLTDRPYLRPLPQNQLALGSSLFFGALDFDWGLHEPHKNVSFNSALFNEHHQSCSVFFFLPQIITERINK